MIDLSVLKEGTATHRVAQKANKIEEYMPLAISGVVPGALFINLCETSQRIHLDEWFMDEIIALIERLQE